ncbi:MAG: hypothetical protein N3D20_03180, partial [Candidatus Pacearchaeota archaeon]|nr:hypothetical protein [Candidatus Pacearchaeota archaeon]
LYKKLKTKIMKKQIIIASVIVLILVLVFSGVFYYDFLKKRQDRVIKAIQDRCMDYEFFDSSSLNIKKTKEEEKAWKVYRLVNYWGKVLNYGVEEKVAMFRLCCEALNMSCFRTNDLKTGELEGVLINLNETDIRVIYFTMSEEDTEYAFFYLSYENKNHYLEPRIINR